ncbi:MAG: hypothetical protein PWQ96_31 [Clostridia bacterium]|jgi:putative sporulation protein YyaC|nr:hypothetical protein [Clostridiales bacterium]MDK2984389.1 hypothetical protein [Clostridia bacterium]
MKLSFLENNGGKPLIVRKYYEDLNIIDHFSTVLAEMLISLDKSLSQPIVIVGVGTDRSTGDSFGPLVGNMLLTKNIQCPGEFAIYGTLNDPVHATNLENKLKEINNIFYNPIVIGIDACLGRSDSVGYITLAEGPLKPGTGVKKQLPEVGQLHLTGIVNVGGYLEYFVLQNTRLSIVMNMAEVTSEIIAEGIAKTTLYKKSVLP